MGGFTAETGERRFHAALTKIAQRLSDSAVRFISPQRPGDAGYVATKTPGHEVCCGLILRARLCPMVQASAVISVLAGLQAIAFFAVEMHFLQRSGGAGFIAALMKNFPRLGGYFDFSAFSVDVHSP